MSFADVPAPMQYAPRENMGVLLSNAIGSVAQSYVAGKANEDTAEFQKAFGQAYAKNDLNAMQQLAAAHPQQWQTVQQGMTAINQNNRQQLGQAASDISLAAMSGNPQAVTAAANAHAQTLQGLGITPDQLGQAYAQNPQQVGQYADMLGMHALDPKDYFTIKNATAQRIQTGNYQQQKLQQDRSQFQVTSGIQQQNANTAATNAQTGQQRLSLDATLGQLQHQDRQMANQLKSQGLTQDLQAKQAASIQTKMGVIDAYDTGTNQLTNMVNTVGQIRAIPADTFENMFGLSGTVNNAVPWSSDAKDGWALISQMQGQARQMGIIGMKGTGPVSDAEGQAAAQAFLALKPGISAKAAKAAIDNWNEVLDRQAKYQQKRAPLINQYRQQVSQYTSQQQQGMQQPQGAQQPQGTGQPVAWGSF